MGHRETTVNGRCDERHGAGTAASAPTAVRFICFNRLNARPAECALQQLNAVPDRIRL